MCHFVIICKKENNDKDYEEEVNDLPSAPCSTCRDDCYQIVRGGKNQLYAFYYHSKNIQYDVRFIHKIIIIIITILFSL